MRDPANPAKRRTYEAAFRAEALPLATQSRSTQAAARALNTDPKRRYQWQKPPKRQLRPPWTRPWTRLRRSGCAHRRPPIAGRRRNRAF